LWLVYSSNFFGWHKSASTLSLTVAGVIGGNRWAQSPGILSGYPTVALDRSFT
jgi:hypothetical protein